jgi:hypothetical protein
MRRFLLACAFCGCCLALGGCDALNRYWDNVEQVQRTGGSVNLWPDDQELGVGKTRNP